MNKRKASDNDRLWAFADDELLIDSKTNWVEQGSPTCVKLSRIIEKLRPREHRDEDDEPSIPFFPYVVDEVFQMIKKQLPLETWNKEFLYPIDDLIQWIEYLIRPFDTYHYSFQPLMTQYPNLLPDILQYLHRKRIEQEYPSSDNAVTERNGRRLVRDKRTSSIESSQKQYDSELEVLSKYKHKILVAITTNIGTSTKKISYQWMSLTPITKITKREIKQENNSFAPEKIFRKLYSTNTGEKKLINPTLFSKKRDILSHRIYQEETNSIGPLRQVHLSVSSELLFSIPSTYIIQRPRTKTNPLKYNYDVIEADETDETKTQQSQPLNVISRFKGRITTETPLSHDHPRSTHSMMGKNEYIPENKESRPFVTGQWTDRFDNVIDVGWPMPWTLEPNVVRRSLVKNAVIEFSRCYYEKFKRYIWDSVAGYSIPCQPGIRHASFHLHTMFHIKLDSTRRYHELMELRQEILSDSLTQISTVQSQQMVSRHIVSVLEIWDIVCEYQL